VLNIFAKGLLVAAVEEESIASEMEIEPGDRILSIDGREINDIIDFQYYTAETEFTLLIEKAGGEIWELEIERSEGEYLGLEVETVGCGGLKTCQNNCAFCFIAQMPPGLRSSLYDKDDDYRLSLTQGSFITLTNLSEQEFMRIIKFHLSPLYISVHAWNPEIRFMLMRNPRAADLSQQLERLVAAGITFHAQIVLVPGYNDGLILQETVERLSGFWPALQSIAVVPVGLTKYRQGLVDLRSFQPAEARQILAEGLIWQDEFKKRYDYHLVYFSDEFYTLAGVAFPPQEIYDDFPQLENGIGIGTKFAAELESVWGLLPAVLANRSLHIVTGISAEGFIKHWLERLESRIKGINITLHVISNHFFGETVTVAGLLTAEDLAGQLGDLRGEEFLIPCTMLNADGLFLDNQSVAWLEEKVKGRAVVVGINGVAFVESILGYNLQEVSSNESTGCSYCGAS
jgi:Fe-S oxidoreductase, related to NifB/MoaA family